MRAILTMCISMYSVLKTKYEWAKLVSLTLMLTVQLVMALWSLLADPIDRLEGCFLSSELN